MTYTAAAILAALAVICTPEHSPDRHSVMYWVINTREKITDADRQQRKLFTPAR